MPRLMGVMSYAYRFATPENDWEALLFRHLPPWLVITDAGLVKDFYEGEAGFLHGRLLAVLGSSHPLMVGRRAAANSDVFLPNSHD